MSKKTLSGLLLAVLLAATAYLAFKSLDVLEEVEFEDIWTEEAE